MDGDQRHREQGLQGREGVVLTQADVSGRMQASSGSEAV